MLGFCYLVNPDVAFSMWFFNLLSLMVRGGMAYFGYRITENLGIYGSPSPLFKHLGMGAMIVLVVAGLWSAKAHLKEVFRKALFGKRTVDDSDEILSYRASVWGMLLGLIYMGFWLHASGIPGAHGCGISVCRLRDFHRTDADCRRKRDGGGGRFDNRIVVRHFRFWRESIRHLRRRRYGTHLRLVSRCADIRNGVRRKRIEGS